MLPFLKDAKKEASVIVDSLMGDKKETKEVEGEEVGKHEDGMRIAGQEIVNALETKDAGKLVRAIRSLIDMHSSQE